MKDKVTDVFLPGLECESIPIVPVRFNKLQASWRKKVIMYPCDITFDKNMSLWKNIKWFFYWVGSGWLTLWKENWNSLRRS